MKRLLYWYKDQLSTGALSICLILIAISVLTGCSARAMRDDVARPSPTYATPPADSGVLADMAKRVEDTYGSSHSTFGLLDGSDDGLRWRLALIDSAVSSIDIQTYLWYPDISGRLILERVVLASQRGVHVRLIVDDLLMIGLDQLLADLEQQPNVELRLFNPWNQRRLGGRAAEMIAEMERLNTRMHNKLLIADGNAAVIGGRNIGDHYFGLNRVYNFRDLDLFAVGHTARQASDMFDEFWNSEWVVSAENLTTEPDSELARQAWQRIQESSRTAEELSEFPRQPKDWTEDLEYLEETLHAGTSELVHDSVAGESVNQTMISDMAFLFQRAESELLITNAYIVPYQRGIDFLADITARGVDVRILTNSLETHDTPSVNAHYQRWRDDFIRAGAILYELRSNAEVQKLVDVPPVTSEFIGLHTKAAVIDRREVFIGSMNLDPRSANINTEMGVIASSPGLARELAAVMLRDMNQRNSWQVFIDDDDDLYWVNSDETVYRQPARSAMQRVMNLIFQVVPKEQN